MLSSSQGTALSQKACWRKRLEYVKRNANRARCGSFSVALSCQVHDGRGTERHRGYGSGLLGDRAYALVDSSDEKVATAKNPRKWPNLFDFRATFIEPPHISADLPPVRITLPDGTIATSQQGDLHQILSNALNRKVTLNRAGRGYVGSASAEEYWPDIEGLDYRDTVTDFALPEGTFFDCATVHLLTTATLDQLRELYPTGRFEVRRFRPNIVMEPTASEKAFIENSWIGHTLAIGDEVRLSITGPCPRCVMTTLPQGDLPKYKQVNKFG